MNIVNCKRCDKIFQRTIRDICPECVKEEKAAFETVKAFLRDHRDATLPVVVEGTMVPLEVIVEMIHDGLLMLKDFPNLSLECARCGALTQESRYCAKCSNELVLELANATEQVKKVRDEFKSGYYSK